MRSYRYYAPRLGRGWTWPAWWPTWPRLSPARSSCCTPAVTTPTGYDLTGDDWERVAQVVAARGLVPFLDLAYQGFSEGLEADAAVVRRFASLGVPMLVASSFSKSFSLYGERVGGLSVVAADAEEAARVRSQLKVTIRTTYSNPPTHGAAVVSAVLGDPALRRQWEDELEGMRLRIPRDAFRAGGRPGRSGCAA